MLSKCDGLMWRLLLMVALLVLAVGACAAPPPDSDSAQRFERGTRVKIDSNVYTITGIVYEDPASIVRQDSGARGYCSYDGLSGYGSYWGPQLVGKGLVRLYVLGCSPESPLAPSGSAVILKVTDTKATNLRPGDEVTFKCRAQHEPVAATERAETLTAEHDTWELDYCRMASPVIQMEVSSGTPDDDGN